MTVVEQTACITGPKIRQFYQAFQMVDGYSILLEGMDNPDRKTNQWALMGFNPRQILNLTGATLTHQQHEKIQTIPIQNEEALFNYLRSVLKQCKQHQSNKPLPFTGGFVGALGYHFSRWCDPALNFMKPATQQPELLWCEFEDWIVIDKLNDEIHWLVDNKQRKINYQTYWKQIDEIPFNVISNLPKHPDDYLNTFKSSLSPTAFAQKTDQIIEQIMAGNVYQANLSLQLKKEITVSPVHLYNTISQINPSPFASIFQWPEGAIVSNSPERLVKINEAQQIETRPIAGTRGRGQNDSEDKIVGETLQQNEKEQAEHLMLVDLLRNDLGRVSQAGSVAVDELMILERYSHVTHLVSNITGQLKSNLDCFDALKAVFPGGTITGCPKIRCMQILDTMEPVPRGFYTGSIGYIDAATGQMDWNILIRSLFLEKQQDLNVTMSNESLRYNAAIHVGAGIVADSVGKHEYKECLRKAAALLGVLHHVESHNPD